MGGWALWALVAGALGAATPPARPQVVPALVKVRPGMEVRGSASAALSLARGECEAVQVVLAPGAPTVPRATLELRGPGGARLRGSVWREGYIEVRTPSNAQGDRGLWPDALLPLGAPPTPGAPQVLYTELCAPQAQAPGLYRGELVLEGAPAVPFRAVVQPFSLPPTSSLPNTFGISLYSVARGHGLRPESDEARALLHAYALALLEHRVSAHGMSMSAPPVRFEDGKARLDFSAYEREMAPFLEGSALPSGARFTTAEVRDSRTPKTEAEKVAYYRAFAEHFRAKGWPQQLFFYAKDEPRPEDVPLVLAQAARVREAGRGVPVLVTAPLDPALRPAADILTPVLNCFFPRPGPQTCRAVVPLPTLRARLGAGKRVWWYQSCMSHGCNGGPMEDPALESAFSGWASYMVDHPAPLNRAMGPLAFFTGVDGELYFDTVHAFRGADPWGDVFAFGGNGDGTLFYPGTPARLGEEGHRPVLSLRLKHIRDGLEDYEYLRLLARAGEERLARASARRLARSGYEVETRPEEWERVRAQVTARLAAHWGKSEYAPRAPVRR